MDLGHFASPDLVNLYSPDKVHPVANNENKNNIKLIDLTKNNTLIHTARCDNKQYTMHRIFFGLHGHSTWLPLYLKVKKCEL